jgi:hypothetical protein
VYLMTAAQNDIMHCPPTVERIPFQLLMLVLQWRILTDWVRINN